jgi:hypothetical protein
MREKERRNEKMRLIVFSLYHHPCGSSSRPMEFARQPIPKTREKNMGATDPKSVINLNLYHQIRRMVGYIIIQPVLEN